MVVHSSDRKPFKCPYCILRYSYQSHLKQHIEKNHFVKDDLNHYCVICKIHFTKKSQLHKHNYIHTGEKAFKCYYPFCDKSFFNEGKLNLHIQKSHNLSHQINNINGNLNQNNNNNYKNTNKIEMNNIKSLNNLVSNNLSENISTCIDNNDLAKSASFCASNALINVNKEEEFESENISEQQQHKNSDYEMLLKIKRIDKIKDVEDLKYINNLQESKDIAINHKKTNLSLASSRKRKSRKFSSEVFAEKKEKSFYRCPIGDCIKTYTSPYNLKVHIKTFHYKIQQFKCQVCGQLFNHKCSLNNHILKTNHLNSAQEEEANEAVDNPELNDFEIFNLYKKEEKNENSLEQEIEEEENSDSNFENNNEINQNKDREKRYCDEEQNFNFKFANDLGYNYLVDFKDTETRFAIINDEDKFGFEMNNHCEINEDDNLLFRINPNFLDNNES